MAEPLELQNLLGRTPLVEKTVSAQREDVQQMQIMETQIHKQKLHEDENVRLKRESARIEQKKKEQGAGRGPNHGQGEGEPEDSAQRAGVELVQESAETPVHKLDVTI